jgi:hypothetical protein
MLDRVVDCDRDSVHATYHQPLRLMLASIPGSTYVFCHELDYTSCCKLYIDFVLACLEIDHLLCSFTFVISLSVCLAFTLRISFISHFFR